MRAGLVLSAALTLTLALALPGCFSMGNPIAGPSTAGDRNRTTWQISDGLCGGGLFGAECDLGQRIAVGAAPLVQVRARGGANLTGATLSGGTGVTLSGVSSTVDDDGVLLQAHVLADAGTADVLVLDASGNEIDRAHIAFVAPATLLCGVVGPTVVRDVAFDHLTGDPVDVTMMAGTTSTSTPLACRATDAAGNPLLTIHAVTWTIASGAVGSITIESDDLLGSTPAVGATARIVTAGEGHATVHAALGTVSDDVEVTFH